MRLRTKISRIDLLMKSVAMISMVGLGMHLSVAAEQLQLTIQAGEYWRGRLSAKGHEMPYDSSSKVNYDLWVIIWQPGAAIVAFQQGVLSGARNAIQYAFDKGTITVTTRKGRI